MYEELVKRLRAMADAGHADRCDECPYDEDYPCCVDCLDTTLKQAAEAIEDLSRHYCPHAIRNAHDRGDDSLCRALGTEPPKEEA